MARIEWGASALMQGRADGYFIIPLTIGDSCPWRSGQSRCQSRRGEGGRGAVRRHHESLAQDRLSQGDYVEKFETRVREVSKTRVGTLYATIRVTFPDSIENTDAPLVLK